VTPTAGVVGTQVTIMGSGFGAGTGQIWLGTMAGVVQSWSDGMIVAQVAARATSGNAMVLQNAVWSNPIPFTVDTLLITAVTPVSGVSGTPVTISGSGFGATQGAGTLILGGTISQVVSWSDTQIQTVVGASAITGAELAELGCARKKSVLSRRCDSGFNPV
jgi:IPT/TIG domain